MEFVLISQWNHPRHPHRTMSARRRFRTLFPQYSTELTDACWLWDIRNRVIREADDLRFKHIKIPCPHLRTIANNVRVIGQRRPWCYSLCNFVAVQRHCGAQGKVWITFLRADERIGGQCEARFKGTRPSRSNGFG